MSGAYLRDPAAIYAASFARVRELTAELALEPHIAPLAERLVHTTGSPAVAAALRWQGDPVGAAHTALTAGASVLCDCEMVRAGITKRFLPSNNPLVCTLNDADTPARAEALRTTRSAAAIDAWGPQLADAVVAIGNAPTALFRLLELLAEGAPTPAVIFGFPVGFIGAAESKQALVHAELRCPWATLPGTPGGSALAAAAVNCAATAKR